MNAHDDLDLGAVLRGRAGDADTGPGLGLGDIQKKAGRIRRRRTAAAGAGVAAALAIIVPAALFGGGVIGGDAGDKEPGVTGQPVSIQKGPALDVSDLPTGDAPKVPWISVSRIHTPDGDFSMPVEAEAEAVVPYDDGWFLRALDGGGWIVDADGQVIDQVRSAGGLPVASADGRYTLYTAGTEGTELHLHDNETGDDQVIHEQSSEVPDPVGVAMVLAPEVDTEPRLVAYYNLMDEGTGERTPVTWSGGETRRIEGRDTAESGNTTEASFVEFNAVTPEGTYAAYTSVSDFGETCSAVFAGHGNELGRTCDYSLDALSPDGSYVAGGPAYRSGLGDTSLALLTSEGLDPQVAYTITGGTGPVFMEPAVWEDDTHVLVPTFTFSDGEQGVWQLLRIGVDGSVENAIEPIPATDPTTDGIQIRLG